MTPFSAYKWKSMRIGKQQQIRVAFCATQTCSSKPFSPYSRAKKKAIQSCWDVSTANCSSQWTNLSSEDNRAFQEMQGHKYEKGSYSVWSFLSVAFYLFIEKPEFLCHFNLVWTLASAKRGGLASIHPLTLHFYPLHCASTTIRAITGWIESSWKTKLAKTKKTHPDQFSDLPHS